MKKDLPIHIENFKIGTCGEMADDSLGCHMVEQFIVLGKHPDPKEMPDFYNRIEHRLLFYGKREIGGNEGILINYESNYWLVDWEENYYIVK